MAKYNEIELNLLKERLTERVTSSQNKSLEKAEMPPEKPGTSEDDSLRQRLGIEGRIIRVFKKQANAPVRQAKAKGWLYREVMSKSEKI